MSAKYTENYPYKDEVIALYEGLTDEEKQSLIKSADDYYKNAQRHK